MNENVSIKEGNITRKFAPIDKVKVDNTDGTQSIWVPEDDLKTGVLYASENGIYIASEDGYDAYSEVVIRVEKRIDDGDLIDESDTDWKDIDFDGDIGNFDELDNWDVDTLEDFSDDLEGFDDLFNDKDFWDEEKEKPITEDEMGDFDGDSLSGIDPETGKPVEYSVDEDGFLDEEVLPSSIDITREPFRLKYMDGEMISFAGLVVDAYYADGSHYGTIPNGELVFPVKTASIEAAGGGKSYSSDLYPDGISGPSYYEFWAVGIEANYPSYVFTCIAKGIYYKNDGKDLLFVGASKEEGAHIYITQSFNRITGEPDQTYNGYANLSYTHNNKTVWYTEFTFIGLGGGGNLQPLHLDKAKAAWTMIYGEESGGTQTVPVNWIREDGEILSDSFEIEVLPGEGGGDSGGESGGESGGISYGGKDYMLNPNSVVGLSYDAESKKVIAPNIGEYKVDQAIDVGLLIPKE